MFKPTGNFVFVKFKNSQSKRRGMKKIELVHSITGEVVLRDFYYFNKNNGKIQDVAHGDSRSRLYQIWQNMKARCFNKNATEYFRYGGKGITVCNEWLDYLVFRKDMINSYSEKLSLDRIDNEKGYCKENCRWVTPQDQVRNQKREITYHFLTINGFTKRIYEFLEENNIKLNTYQYRIYRGWDEARACTENIKPLTKNQIMHYAKMKK